MKKENEFHPQIGEVYLMDFNGSGSEQTGVRPGLVFQNNTGNLYSPNIIALPLTSAVKKIGQPTHVILRAKSTGLHMDSVVLCENPERMSKGRLGKYIAKLSENDMKRVAIGSLLATSAIAFLDKDALLNAWTSARSLNAVPAVIHN